MDLEKSKVSRAVSRLAERNLLSKKINKSDKRLIDLKITRAGSDIIKEMTDIAIKFEAKFLQQIEAPSNFKAIINTLLKN